VATHTKDAWKFCTTGDGEQFVAITSVTLKPEYFAINLALGK